MMHFISANKHLAAVVVATGLLVAAPASALDNARDRSGLFWGMGFGGGGAVRVPGKDAGGAVNFDLQLGAGVQNVTLAFDIDIVTIIFNGERDVIVNPGPEISYFFGDTGIFIRAGLGPSMNIVNVGDDSEFRLGFDVGGGFGWELFANTNLAVGIAAEADYIIRRGSDLAVFGIMFTLRYY